MYLRENQIFERMLKLGLGEKSERMQNVEQSAASFLEKELYATIFELDMFTDSQKEKANSSLNTVKE